MAILASSAIVYGEQHMSTEKLEIILCSAITIKNSKLIFTNISAAIKLETLLYTKFHNDTITLSWPENMRKCANDSDCC